MKFINLNSKCIHDWGYNESDIFKTNADIPITRIKNKIVLVSLNDYKCLPVNDVMGFEKERVKKYIKNGYKSFGNLSKNLISINYSICPNCGELSPNIDTSKDIIVDCLNDFNKVREMKFNIIQSYRCFCGSNNEMSTAVTTHVDIRADILKKALYGNVNVLLMVSVKLDYEMYYIYIDFNKFCQLPFEELTNNEYKKIKSLNCVTRDIKDISRISAYFLDNRKVLLYILTRKEYAFIIKKSDIEDTVLFDNVVSLDKQIIDTILGGFNE